jgi:hypothetical protein
MFYIGFTTRPRTDNEGRPHALGGIELGSDSGAFEVDLTVWSPQQYDDQWRAGGARIAAGATSSALITSYRGDDAESHAIWAMWRVGTDIIFAEQIVPGELIPASDVTDAFYRAVGDRRSTTDDGEPVSEWAVPFAQVLSFLAEDE